MRLVERKVHEGVRRHDFERIGSSNRCDFAITAAPERRG